jgi:Uma2 family endonuclease
MTVDEFLAWDDGTDARYELVGGEIVAMAPATDRNGTIVINIGGALNAVLKPPCRVVGEAGIRRSDRNDRYYVADLAVTCAAPSAGQAVEEPVLIVEVLSPTTEAHDRGRKIPDYRQIPTVAEVLLVSSTRVEIELWRHTGASWVVNTASEGAIELQSVQASIDFPTMYRNTGLL